MVRRAIFRSRSQKKGIYVERRRRKVAMWNMDTGDMSIHRTRKIFKG